MLEDEGLLKSQQRENRGRGPRLVACRCRVRCNRYFDFDGATEIEEAIIVLPGMVPCEVTI